ncbi:MAG TPA: EAL domain-containing protein [Thermoanaerobaculia bacterium]|nr:EAL domain-containing protein [Thermoanaerobaculia bacterium]
MNGDLLSGLRLDTHFQGVWVVGHGEPTLHYVECLSRGPESTSFRDASVLFEYARRKGQETALDRLAIAFALRRVPRPVGPRVAVNIHVATLVRDPEILEFCVDLCREVGLAPERLVFEVVESLPTWPGSKLADALDHVRGLGIGLALDDFGTHHSNFELMLALRPNYLKIDRRLVQTCATDSYRTRILATLVELGRTLGVLLIAEGVEREEDLNRLEEVGIDLAQGYLLDRPSSQWPQAALVSSAVG